MIQCISLKPWLEYPGCDEPGGCHDLTLGKIYEMLGVEGKGSLLPMPIFPIQGINVFIKRDLLIITGAFSRTVNYGGFHLRFLIL